ncbi:CdaR family protein [Paenibacillus sp. CC-CFT747]|nr:CdaR family protein [Paenibacillus sp. CC-CFT747]
MIKPNRVQVTVPESRLEEVDAAKADISVDKATGNISKQVKLTVYDKAGKPIEGIVNPQLVEVEVPVTSPLSRCRCRSRSPASRRRASA